MAIVGECHPCHEIEYAARIHFGDKLIRFDPRGDVHRTGLGELSFSRRSFAAGSAAVTCSM